MIKKAARLIVVLLLAGAILMRWWQIGNSFYFGIDEEYQSLLALSQLKDWHPIWIGTSQANTGFYLGPLLVYIHAILLGLSGKNPIILAYTASIFSSITIIIFYLLARQFYDKKTAIIASTLLGFSSFMVYYDRRFWSPFFVPLFTILFLFTYIRLKKDYRLVLVLAILNGLAFHIHASLLLHLPISIFLAIYYFRTAHKKYRIYLAFAVFIFLCLISPLIVFDLNHNFSNLLTPMRLWQNGNLTGNYLAMVGANWQTFSLVVSRFWNFSYNPIQILAVATAISLICFWFIFRRNKSSSIQTLFYLTICFQLVLWFSPIKIVDYYYLSILPLLALVFALLLSRLPAWCLILFLPVWLWLGYNKTLPVWQSAGLGVKKAFIQKITPHLNNQPYYLETDSDYLHPGGWRYLFLAYGKTPAQSQADEMFGWIYPDEIAEKPPKLRVIISKKETQPDGQLLKKIVQFPFTAYVFKN